MFSWVNKVSRLSLLRSNSYFTTMATHTNKGPIHQAIERKLTESLQPTQLDIVNESHKHAHHSAMRGVDSKETHFKVTIISHLFEGKNLMQRHRLIYQIVDEEMGDGKIHALSLKTKTPDELAKLKQ